MLLIPSCMTLHNLMYIYCALSHYSQKVLQFMKKSVLSLPAFSSVFCYMFLYIEPSQAYYFGLYHKGLTFKILLKDLWWSSGPTTKYNEIQELIASFSNLGLNANLSLFTNTDIMPYHLSHHHLLNLDNLLTLLLSSPPLDTSFFLTPPLLPTHSLYLISPSLNFLLYSWSYLLIAQNLFCLVTLPRIPL